MKKILRLFGYLALAAVAFTACEVAPTPTSTTTTVENDPVTIKKIQVRDYVESIVTSLAREPQAASPGFLDELSRESKTCLPY